jgi:16S rRNA (guanine527-N7)-methyltransferase
MEMLAAGAAELGFTLSASHLAQFERYYRELVSWNERFNLTAVTAYDQVQRRHFLDSLTCMLAFPSGDAGSVPATLPVQRTGGPLRCADVGSGAGFPGIPLAILMSDASFTLIEATQKKVGFLQHVANTLSLTNVSVVCARAEEVGQQPQHRENYDVVLARAVAGLATLAEYCLPLCRVGGRMIAPKGRDIQDELVGASHAFDLLGGRLVCARDIALPGEDDARTLVVVDKVARTPERYPRNAGIPAKRPLNGD